jgi:hypothetical protein
LLRRRRGKRGRRFSQEGEDPYSLSICRAKEESKRKKFSFKKKNKPNESKTAKAVSHRH